MVCDANLAVRVKLAPKVIELQSFKSYQKVKGRSAVRVGDVRQALGKAPGTIAQLIIAEREER